MKPREFLIEEYRQLHTEVKVHQEAYSRLERLTFGGVLVVYGFFLTNIAKVPAAAWSTIPILIGIAAVRCFAHYWIINRRYAIYLETLEAEVYEGKFEGFQRFFSRRTPGRNSNMLFNAVGWCTLIAFAIAAAIWRFKFYQETYLPL